MPSEHNARRQRSGSLKGAHVDRRYDAIIFDLFGTLVNNISTTHDYRCLAETAQVLGADPQAFIDFWTESTFRAQRRSGYYHSTTCELDAVCRGLALTVIPEQLATAVSVLRVQYGLASLIPKPKVRDTLMGLKCNRYALGLISDCSWAVPDVWEQSAFAGIFHTTIFSCVAGARKPDRRLYRLACEGLHVLPARCLYIGDGDGRELSGARQAGMNAILICAPHEREIVMQREDPRQWDGPVIERIEDVLAYLDLPASAETDVAQPDII